MSGWRFKAPVKATPQEIHVDGAAAEEEEQGDLGEQISLHLPLVDGPSPRALVEAWLRAALPWEA